MCVWASVRDRGGRDKSLCEIDGRHHVLVSLGRAARHKELVYVKMMNIHQEVPCEERMTVMWKPTIRLRWVVTDKSGGIGDPNVGSRPVAMEFRRGSALPKHHSATPSCGPTYVMIQEEDLSEGD